MRTRCVNVLYCKCRGADSPDTHTNLLEGYSHGREHEGHEGHGKRERGRWQRPRGQGRSYFALEVAR